MTSTIKVSGRLVAAARALTGVSREDFAAAAGLPSATIASIETNGAAWLHPPEASEAVLRAFDKLGVILVEESDGMGAGVRLKFTRQDVRQIVRLEGEGGKARLDDVP